MAERAGSLFKFSAAERSLGVAETRITLRLRDKKSITVAAFGVVGVNGLLVHYSINRNRFWTITHVASSRIIEDGYSSRLRALRAVQRLASVGDWTRDENEIWADEVFRSAARAVVASS